MQFINLMRPHEVVAELGKRLQEQRLQQNLTQAALAKKLGVSVPTISNLENGKNTTLETFISVVFALGLQTELQDLFNQPSLTIAELDKAAQPKRQRARSKTKPTPYNPALTTKSSSNVADAPNNSRAGLWDRNLFSTMPTPTAKSEPEKGEG